MQVRLFRNACLKYDSETAGAQKDWPMTWNAVSFAQFGDISHRLWWNISVNHYQLGLRNLPTKPTYLQQPRS